MPSSKKVQDPSAAALLAIEEALNLRAVGESARQQHSQKRSPRLELSIENALEAIFDNFGKSVLEGWIVSNDPPAFAEAIEKVKAFEAAIDSLGQVAEELDRLALSRTSMVAAIEAQGNRIDRVNAENHAMLDDLRNGKW